ncbi:arylamine N-acetyltransferase family protein [Heyndrickxia oleronia]|uniref:arylamine N-acetyltransferase family protein n=1 Tax=Heyndrickxia oleronia TaxID=38875 RepID=UPI0037521DC8
MSNLNLLFRERIGFPINKNITFEDLDIILEKTAKTIPFENLCIMSKNTTELTKNNLINKILHKKQGGLCYDLNAILYLFLLENGFQATLFRGVIYNQAKQEWNTIGKTHVAIIVKHNEQRFLVDTGFGGNLPLKPIPLNGEIVSSDNGEFRVKQENSVHDDYIFFMKLKYKDDDWKMGYAFKSNETINDVTALNEIQKIIVEHDESPFNKKPLITILTDSGNLTLTDTSYTEWINGKVYKKEVDKKSFTDILNKSFGIK